MYYLILILVKIDIQSIHIILLYHLFPFFKPVDNFKVFLHSVKLFKNVNIYSIYFLFQLLKILNIMIQIM